MPTKDETILDATLRARPDAPYSCTGGVCGTCRARLVSGEVRMDRNYALEPEEVDGRHRARLPEPPRDRRRSRSTTTPERLPPRGGAGQARSYMAISKPACRSRETSCHWLWSHSGNQVSPSGDSATSVRTMRWANGIASA